MNTPLRILHAVCTDEFAGVEQFILRLALAQSADGHDVSVAGGDPARMRRPLTSAGISYAAVASPAQAARAIRARARDLDVVNTHMTAADLAATIGLIPRPQRPVVVSTRHFAKRRGRLAPLDPLIDPRMDANISISDFVARSIGVHSTVVHPGMPARPDVDPVTREPVVLMAQRLQPEKHSLLGIRAFAASGLASEGWRLDVAGDGPDQTPAEQLARELGVAHAVRLLGFRDDIAARMEQASMLIATCPVEGFGLTVLEAMASGLPVIAPVVGGPAEMLSGLDDRALFAVDDAAHAASHLRSLGQDPAGRQLFGKAARERQREAFTVEAQARGTETVYRETIGARGGEARR